METPDWVASVIAVVALVISVLSWRASHRAANENGRVAAVEEERLGYEQQDRAEAALARRLDVWTVQRITMDAVEFKFLGPEAHHVRFEANVVLSIGRRKSDVSSPMYNGDTMTVQIQDSAGWNKRVEVIWAESEGADAERLRNLYVVK